MIYLQFIKTYTCDSVLAHKGQEVKATQQFRDSIQWLTWARSINYNDDIEQCCFIKPGYMTIIKLATVRMPRLTWANFKLF